MASSSASVRGMGTSSNLFGLSDHNLGCLVLVSGSLFAAITIIMCDVAEDDGVTANAMTMYCGFATFAGALLLDAYFWHTGYGVGDTGDNPHWFVFVDIWRAKQRDKMLQVPTLFKYLLISIGIQWLLTILFLAAFIYVSDVGDAIAIFDGYPIFVPVFGLCFPTGEDWKHRYFVALALVIAGVLLVAQPGFLFGYSADYDATDQAIGCLLALAAALSTAFMTVAWVMVKKVSYLDLLQQRADRAQQQQQPSAREERSPLKGDSDSDKADDGNATLKPFGAPGMGDDELNASMSSLMSDLEATHLQEQSNEFIVQNDWALTNLWTEYYGLALAIECIIFSPFANVQGDAETSWFWDEFAVAYSGEGTKCAWYTLGGALVWGFDTWFYTFGTFKVVNAPVTAILDVSDIFFTFVLSYVWLGETPNGYETAGAVFVILAVIVTVYPWEKLIRKSKYHHRLRNF